MSDDTVKLQVFDSKASLDTALAHAVAHQLSADIEVNGNATLAVSGGNTPVGFFQHLSKAKMDWPKVTVTLVDERWVPPHDTASNERLIRENLLTGNASAAHFVGLWTSDVSPHAGLQTCTSRLQALSWPLSVVVLGMGEDGHSASWFPHDECLNDQLDLDNPALCMPARGTQPRMTLTLSAVLTCKCLFLHITGESKKRVLATASTHRTHSLPVSAVLNQDRKSVEVYWTA